MTSSSPGQRQLVLVIYAVSGFISLGYQVTWFRIFADRFGSTTLTFALVVCTFIGGLGLGSLLSGSLVRRLATRPGLRDYLRIYGLIELLIAAAALLTEVSAFMPADLWGYFPYQEVRGIWEPTAVVVLSQVLVAALCIFVPCTLMGTTYPLLCQAFVDGPDRGRFPALLYAVNTLGACVGVLTCQFILILWIGHGPTFRLMMALNVAVGLWFFLRGGLPMPAARVPVHSTAGDRDPGWKAASPAAPLLQPGGLLALAALSGLIAGALEGDLFRRTEFILNHGATGPSISFWAILAIFLGSTVVHRWRGLRLIHIQVAVALAAAYLFTVWAARDAIVDVLAQQPGSQGSFPTSISDVFIFTGIYVLPPYFLTSMLLPWACNRIHGERRHLGLAYGINTLAFCAGLIAFTVVVPRVNIFFSLKFFPAVLAICAAVLFTVTEDSRIRIWQPVTLLLLVVASWIVTPRIFDQAYFAVDSPPARFPVRGLRSDGAVTTFVVDWLSTDGRQFPILYFGRMSMSGTTLAAQTYMRLMAHFPLLSHPAPRKALLICFGVGNTASAIAAHPEIQQIDAVDLNAEVLATAPEFAPFNGRVYADPRVRMIHSDGRTWLNRTDQIYDLITSEPPPPMAPGAYRLYSVEYYRAAMRRLSPNGLMTQWLPVYEMPEAAERLAVQSFLAVFPHALLFAGFGNDLILVGSPGAISLATLSRRFNASASVTADLQKIGVTGPLSLTNRILMTDEELRRVYAGTRVLSDQHNEFDHLIMNSTEQQTRLMQELTCRAMADRAAADASGDGPLRPVFHENLRGCTGQRVGL